MSTIQQLAVNVRQELQRTVNKGQVKYCRLDDCIYMRHYSKKRYSLEVVKTVKGKRFEDNVTGGTSRNVDEMAAAAGELRKRIHRQAEAYRERLQDSNPTTSLSEMADKLSSLLAKPWTAGNRDWVKIAKQVKAYRTQAGYSIYIDVIRSKNRFSETIRGNAHDIEQNLRSALQIRDGAIKGVPRGQIRNMQAIATTSPAPQLTTPAPQLTTPAPQLTTPAPRPTTPAVTTLPEVYTRFAIIGLSSAAGFIIGWLIGGTL